jgi:hypothetical protein
MEYWSIGVAEWPIRIGELVFERRRGRFAFSPEGVNFEEGLSCSHQPHGARCLTISGSLSC